MNYFSGEKEDIVTIHGISRENDVYVINSQGIEINLGRLFQNGAPHTNAKKSRSTSN